jgi:hypothetical protein
VSRYDLTATVNRLIAAAGLPANEQLPLDASQEQLSRSITLIEHHLELPPLTAGNQSS